MSGDVLMLERIRSNATAVDLLAALEFDLLRAGPVGAVRLGSSAMLEAVAGEGAGGTFFLCGHGERRPVLYATSEGQAGLIAADLTAALELIVGMPLWPDCLKFSARGDLDEMLAAASRLELELAEDFPKLAAHQALLRAELGLGQPPVDELVSRLHAAARNTEPDFVLIGPEGDAYAPLFNTFRVRDNPAWR